MRTLRPISSAMSSISSSLMVWVTVRAWPSRNRRLITSPEGTPSKSANSPTVEPCMTSTTFSSSIRLGSMPALHCLLGNALALSGLALFLTLLTTAFALVIRCGSNGGTRLGEHLIALHLLGLNGHLGVTIFAIVGKLRNVRLKMVASTLTSALGIFLIASSGVARCETDEPPSRR